MLSHLLPLGGHFYDIPRIPVHGLDTHVVVPGAQEDTCGQFMQYGHHSIMNSHHSHLLLEESGLGENLGLVSQQQSI